MNRAGGIKIVKRLLQNFRWLWYKIIGVYSSYLNVNFDNFKRNCKNMPVNYLTKLIKFSFYIDNPLY